jgi:Zn-dependent protease
MLDLNVIQKIAVWAIPVLFAITVHEVSHGWVARQLGDPTAMMLGRLTLNPIKHIDPIGTIVVPLVMLLLGGFVFGWAKPVPVTWENLRNPKRDMAIVAAAGPASNLLMAVIWALLMRLGIAIMPTVGSAGIFLVYAGQAGIYINLVLMVLNLLPIPPLDGGRVLTGLLPGPAAWKVSRIEPYGLIIVVALLVTGVLGQILWPPISYLASLLFALAGISP